jgi:hypothetical protein
MKRRILFIVGAVTIMVLALLVLHGPVDLYRYQIPDAKFGAYRYVYGVRQQNGHLAPWMHGRKNRGPITGLEGQAVEPVTLEAYPGCVTVAVDFDPKVNHGFIWADREGYEMNISSMSEQVQVVACREPVAEFDAIVGPFRD